MQSGQRPIAAYHLTGRCRGGSCRCREWRCSGCGGRGLRFFRPHRLSYRPGRWPGRLQLGNDRIRIDCRRGWSREVAGNTDHLHRDGQRLIFVQRVGDGEAIRRRHGNRARRLAARSEGRDRVGSLRRGFKLDVYQRRRGLEGIHGERRTTGQTKPCHSTHDDTMHDPSVIYCGLPHDPGRDHRSVMTSAQPRGRESLTDG